MTDLARSPGRGPRVVAGLLGAGLMGWGAWTAWVAREPTFLVLSGLVLVLVAFFNIDEIRAKHGESEMTVKMLAHVEKVAEAQEKVTQDLQRIPDPEVREQLAESIEQLQERTLERPIVFTPRGKIPDWVRKYQPYVEEEVPFYLRPVWRDIFAKELKKQEEAKKNARRIHILGDPGGASVGDDPPAGSG